MNTDPLSDALAIRATARSFDAQRGKLPVPDDPHRLPSSIGVAQQISELGKLITELGEEVLSRAVGKGRHSPTTLAFSCFADAVRPAGEAATALGEVAKQLAFLERTEHLHERAYTRDARESAGQVISEALGAADAALRDAANTLHSASTAVSPPSSRLRAALGRTTTPTYEGEAYEVALIAGTAAAPAAPAPRTARGR
ncbi:hypothetical protein ACFV97_25595 [Streptomyces sp. NPDC059913]|uniref:hypothetical protein n=1 Tax=unclassified Streptomyces TaxID=2593676 RepID=UPI0036570C0A